MRLRSTAALKEALNDVDYPADKDSLVRHAVAHGADEPTRRALEALPPADYANLDEVIRSVPLEPDPGRSGSERNQQRGEAKPGLAEHMRERDRFSLRQEFD
jgi:hypothetical protein